MSKPAYTYTCGWCLREVPIEQDEGHINGECVRPIDRAEIKSLAESHFDGPAPKPERKDGDG